MANDNELIFQGSLDTSKMEKQLDDLAKKKSKAVAGEVVSAKDVDNAKKLETQLTTAETKFKQLANAQSNFASGTNQSAAAFSKVTNEMASQIKYMRDRTTDQDKINQLLAKEVELRKQAKDALASTRPPAESINRNGGSGSNGGFKLPELNASSLAGGVLGAGLGAAALALKSFADTVSEAGKKAQEFAKDISDSGGGFDKLRQAQREADYSSSKLAHNPVVLDIEKAKKDFEKSWNENVDRLLTQTKNGLDDLGHSLEKGGVEKNRAAREQGIDKALATPDKMVGSDKIQYDQLKRAGVEMEQDLLREKVKLDHDFMKQHRDLLQEETEERIDYDNKVYDNRLQKERSTRNYQHDLAKLNQDQEFKFATQKYNLELSAEQRNFQLKQLDDRTKFGFSQSDKAQDFAIANRNRAEDFNTNLVDLGLSGGSGLDYLKLIRNTNKEQRRATEQYQIGQGRDTRNFNFDQFTQARDFNLGQGDKNAQRNIDVQQHQYQLDQQRYSLTTSFNDAMQDNTESLKRLTIAQKMAENKFKNKESDLAFSQKTAYEDYNISGARQRRGLAEERQNFAAGLYAKDPYGFDKIAQGNQDLGQDLGGYLQRGGLPGYVNQVDVERQKRLKDRVIQDGTPSYNQPGGDQYDVPAYADGGFTKTGGLALLHPNELILNPGQQRQLFGEVGPVQPIQMPYSQQSPVINIHMGDSPMQFNGAYSEQLQQQLAAIKQDYEAKIQNAVSQAQSSAVSIQYGQINQRRR